MGHFSHLRSFSYHFGKPSWTRLEKGWVRQFSGVVWKSWTYKYSASSFQFQIKVNLFHFALFSLLFTKFCVFSFKSLMLNEVTTGTLCTKKFTFRKHWKKIKNWWLFVVSVNRNKVRKITELIKSNAFKDSKCHTYLSLKPSFDLFLSPWFGQVIKCAPFPSSSSSPKRLPEFLSCQSV